MEAFCSHTDHAMDGHIVKGLRPGFWPLVAYIALTIVLAIALLLLTRQDPASVKEFWGFVAIPLGMPWTIVTLLLLDLPPGPDVGRVAIIILALSLPANAGLLYLLGRHLDRRWSAGLQN